MKVLSIRFLVGLLISMFMLAGVAANSAFAQEKGKAAQAEKGKYISKVLAENDRVRVLENRFRPGDVSQTPSAPFMRVVRVLQGGTLLRTYPDGKTEKLEFKTGETMILMPSEQSVTTKNIGKTNVAVYIVVLK